MLLAQNEHFEDCERNTFPKKMTSQNALNKQNPIGQPGMVSQTAAQVQSQNFTQNMQQHKELVPNLDLSAQQQNLDTDVKSSTADAIFSETVSCTQWHGTNWSI